MDNVICFKSALKKKNLFVKDDKHCTAKTKTDHLFSPQVLTVFYSFSLFLFLIKTSSKKKIFFFFLFADLGIQELHHWLQKIWFLWDKLGFWLDCGLWDWWDKWRFFKTSLFLSQSKVILTKCLDVYYSFLKKNIKKIPAHVMQYFLGCIILL